MLEPRKFPTRSLYSVVSISTSLLPRRGLPMRSAMADNIFSDPPPEKQPVWVYIAKNKEEADRIYSFGFDAVCRAELRPELIAALRNVDVVVLLGKDPATEDKLAPIARQLRVLDLPDLTNCSREQFTRLTTPHW